MTPQLVPLSFPAVADFEVTEALELAAVELGHRVNTGVVVTVRAFFEPPPV